MSHNYPYRRPPSDTDLRPDPGTYSSADHCHTSDDFYRPQESLSYPSSSSSSRAPLQPPALQARPPLQAPALQDGVLSILSSVGLEPDDLALLAELPEDVLTVESLPHILKQIKGKRGTIKPFLSSAPSSSTSCYSGSSTQRPAISTDWDQRQPVQYPLGHVPSSPLSSSSTCRADHPPSSSSSSSSGFTVDYHHRPGPSDYGKTGPVPSQNRPSFSAAEPGNKARTSCYSEARAADFPKPKPKEGHRESRFSSSRSIPLKKQAQDFHGTTPAMYPYSCSLCHITVLSERVWIQHINGTLHADGQLSLLQQFPNWDCRMETAGREDNEPEKRRDDKKRSPPRQTSSQNQTPQTNQKQQKKTSDKGKVVCVKFPPQSVDESYLRKLTEPFGKILKILMFPSLAFLELGTVDQAKDLVKFHINYPPTVNGEQIEFSISNAFSFLWSCQVVSFSPAPAGEDGRSDLISIVKRFGLPLYTLFLPSVAFVEMRNVVDAQKLVDYYSTNTLRINKDSIKVSFSEEYKRLMNIPSAKKYEEEPTSAKRSSSPEKNQKSGTKRTRSESNRDRKSRSRSRDRQIRTKSRSRDKSKERSSRHRKTRSRSRDKSSSRSSRNNRSRSSRNTRTRSRSRSMSSDKSRTKSSREIRSKSREKSDREKKSRSKSREKTSREKGTGSASRSRDESSTGPSREKMVEPESKDEPTPVSGSKPEAAEEMEEEEEEEEEAGMSAEESDIEGMEVIAEDGEDLEDEEVESQEEEEDEEEEEEEAAEENESPAERTQSLEPGRNQSPQEEDFPVDLENCITLDELDEDKSDKDTASDDGVPDRPKSSQSSRVLYFANLPPRFSDSEFVRLVKGFGTAARYILIRTRQEV
ncbi:matrin 3-like 1.1 [Stegastes partitus]|uniref:Matrin 3-like 1.1 n=1 Tax=Stegastes partitus TaxID=144197 RepID=A0A9Y4NE74_9TELE|nr:PREDICTED: matrin-3-like [Stegastes partitus]